jgi:hypothetical protein
MAKTIREVRLTFNEKDKDISEWLKGKSSQTAYIKDLLRLHMQIEQSYLANDMNVEQSVSRETVKVEEKKQDEFDFDLSDLNL